MRSRKSVVQAGWISFLVVLAVCLSACRKDPNSAVGENLGDRDFLTEHYQDTAFDIVVYSRPDTGLIVQNAERMLLGSVQDNVFGRTDYHVYTQLRYEGSNTETGGFVSDGGPIDSVVLILPYSMLYPVSRDATYGRPIRVTVHELTEGLLDSDNIDSVYSVSSEVMYNPAGFGDAVEFIPRSFDSITDTVLNQTYVPALRVRLDPSLGLRLMTLPQEAYDSLAAFQRYINGICLRSVPVATQDESAVVSFALGTTSVTDEIARIMVYHGLVAPDTARYSVFTFGPIRFTKVDRDYNTSIDPDFLAQMRGDSLTAVDAGRRAVYLACSGGAYVVCALPNVRELFADRRIIINRASLVLKAASKSNGSGISLPQTLQIPGSLDDAYSQDGRWNADGQEYRLTLTRYLQRLFYEEAVPEPFFIYPSTTERYGTPCAVKLNGPAAGNGSPMKLELIYTEVKE